MYRIQTEHDKYDLLELENDTGTSWLRICPERGGIVTSLGLHGEELLYFDKATFYDPGANIRGGIPVLFPICGALEEGRYEWDGTSYSMKQHGFARNLPWQVTETVANKESASVTLRLTSTEVTREQFPFDVVLEFTYVLAPGKLEIQQRYTNQSNVPMPMYAGFHPYFATANKRLALETDVANYFDHNDKRMKPYTGVLDMTDLKESVEFHDPHVHQVSFATSDSSKSVRLSVSDDFPVIVVWSVTGKDFICVEPWMAEPNAMNSRERLRLVGPHQTMEASVVISVD